jgi:hypothetical protein
MTRLLMLACSAAILLFSHAALAKPKIALTQIEGDAKGDIHEAVSEALDGNELSLIGSKEVNRAVDKLGDLTDLTEKDFRKLANELEADAIVLGKLDKVGRSRTLRFRLFIHKKMAKGFTVSFKNAKSEKFRSMLHDKMVDKIGAAVGDAGEDDRSARKRAAEDEDPLATKKDKKLGKRAKAEDEDEEEVRPAKKTRVAEDEDRPSKKAKAEAEDDEDASRTRKAKAEGDSESTERAEREEGDDAEGDDAEGDDKPEKKASKKAAAKKAPAKKAAAKKAPAKKKAAKKPAKKAAKKPAAKAPAAKPAAKPVAKAAPAAAAPAAQTTLNPQAAWPFPTASKP